MKLLLVIEEMLVKWDWEGGDDSWNGSGADVQLLENECNL